MKIQQWLNILKVAIIATAIMVVFEGIFEIPQVNDFFGGLITGAGAWVYAVIWLIMFLQVTILNIPAYVVLSASISVGIHTLSWEYILTVMTAYMAGCVLAYALGRAFGVKAVKWCAGSQEDFDKWSKWLNQKGKWIYPLTVTFPFFPDDLLCIVAGAVKFKFWWYMLSNLVGRLLGLITTLVCLEFLGSIGSGSNFPTMLVAWGLALYAEIVAFIVLKKKSKKVDTNS